MCWNGEHWSHLIIVNKTAARYYKQLFTFTDQRVQYIIKTINNIEYERISWKIDIEGKNIKVFTKVFKEAPTPSPPPLP